MQGELAVGVDIGGTKIAFALVNQSGQVVIEHRVPTQPEDGVVAVLDRVADGVTELLDRAGQPVSGIGIGCPGFVNPVEGVARHAVNLGWTDVPLREELQARIGSPIPIAIRKDVDAGALAERLFGAARGCEDFVYIAVGTGLGMSVMTGGRLVTGADYCGVELGHVALMPNGRLCGCGLHGCAEMYVSGVGVLAGVREYRTAYPDSPLTALDVVTTADVLDAARAGDGLANRVLSEAEDVLALLASICVGLLNPALFVIGGGLGLALSERWIAALERDLPRRTLAIANRGLRVVRAQVESSAVGAAALVWEATGG